MMDHETWRRNLLSVIRDLADAGYQERVWVRGAGPEVDSMSETICRFFDDLDVDDFLAASTQRPMLSLREQESLMALRDAVESFLEEDADDPRAIWHPKWRQIQELAARASEALSRGASEQTEAFPPRS